MVMVAGVIVSPGGVAPAWAARSQDRAATTADARGGAQPILLEFDLPDDFWARTAAGEFQVVAIRIGFFQPKVATPLMTRDAGRAAIAVEGRVGRLPIPDVMPFGYGRVVMRLQSLSASGPGPWSEPSPPVTLAERPPPSGPPRPRTLADLERYPALNEALQQLLGRRATGAEVSTFRRIEDLATAVVLSQKYELVFPDLCKILRGPPPLTLRGAVRRLLPSLDNRQVVRAAGIEAQALLK
jgi:hypothetical protein